MLTFCKDAENGIVSNPFYMLKTSTISKLRELTMGLIIKSIPSDDGKICKVEVRVVRQGTVKTFTVPITKFVFLLPFAD